MEINLKKSAALQVAINDAVRELDLSTHIDVSIFSQHVETDIDVGIERLQGALFKRENLKDALFVIRDLTGAANTESGVDGLLSASARIKSDIEMLGVLVGAVAREPIDIVKAKIERIKAEVPAADRRFGSVQRDDLMVSLLTDEDIQGYKADLNAARRKAQDLKDALLEKNISTKITLPAETVKVLKAAGLV
ncbi:MAG: hypothetical protein ABJN42_07415 [Roseibium sp.]|uniref:hypothetical protein n=1 Tax=Alphaproteobacteria TaxID=28211 RepID=UPI0032972AAC